MKLIQVLRSGLLSIICLTVFAVGLNAADATATAESKAALPRLIDLGANKCIPCKMMKPILDELTKEYAGQLEVVFIDVWEKREAGERYGISIIPTQIFFDSNGKELARHEGFFAKKDILAKWKSLGVTLNEPAAAKKE